MVQKDAPAQTPSTQAAPAGEAKSAPVENKAAPTARRTSQMGDHREGEQRAQGGERREGRSEGGERNGVNIRIGGNRDGYRHGRHLGYAQVGGHCRTVLVKSFRHGHRVIQRTRRCW